MYVTYIVAKYLDEVLSDDHPYAP